MIDVEKFVLKNEIEKNPLFNIHMRAMKYFGYMLFKYQRFYRLHCLRGVVFTVSFILFNITQVSKLCVSVSSQPYQSQNVIFKLIFTLRMNAPLCLCR
jgi:hypothetical protein